MIMTLSSSGVSTRPVDRRARPSAAQSWWTPLWLQRKREHHELARWATGDLGAPSGEGARPPTGVELDDDPRAIHRLLGFIHPDGCARVDEAFSPPHRQQGHAVRLPSTERRRAAGCWLEPAGRSRASTASPEHPDEILGRKE